MADIIIRQFQTADGNFVQGQLRSAWRLQIPKQFNLTQVIAEQPLAHAIVAMGAAVIFAWSRDLGTICLALPGLYIVLFFIILIYFLFQADEILLKELQNIPENYQQDDCSEFWIAETIGEGKEIVGTVGLQLKTKTLAQIRHLMVVDDRKDKGLIAEKLLHKCLSFAKSKQFIEVELLASAVSEDIGEVFAKIGLKVKHRFNMPSKHLYILPMHILHQKLEDIDLDQIS